ncbi:DUF262 domain-containing protein [Saccharopolyspora indica]|uniref:DUF262 domain-containing protein n=1 Tax=Saccharopolyspora indica TaxID=1229659 RepID=UPI0022EB969E|nr:DUF262 domain-containing protein [Saccharopolyspora indica]MDA3644325.1 DUF262 domain-containing protein [Saccharopolyspora indica]
MPDKPERMTVREFMTLAQEGQFDVLEFQRIFNRDVMWVRHLIDSFRRKIPINSLLLWEPASGASPAAGRYRDRSEAKWWIVDGQQRCAGTLAAFGALPGWMPADRWAACGGDRLGVMLTTNRRGEVVIAEGRHRGPQVSLADLLVASEQKALPEALAKAGFPMTDASALEFDHFLADVLNAQLLLEWLPDDIDDPFLAFKRHNSRATQLSLKQEELELSLLASCFGPLLRNYIDPALDEAAAQHLGKAFTRRRLNNALQLMLPSDQRKLNAVRADAETVEDAAKRVRQVCPVVIRYLHEHGLVHDEVISAPGVVDILMALFDRVPHASADLFPMRWIAHIAAGNLFFGRPSTARDTLNVVLNGGSYEQIQAGIAALVPPGRPAPYTEERLHPTPKQKTSFGTNGTLFSMTSAHPVGTMRDLAVDDLWHPSPRMRLRPLCEEHIAGLMSHYTFMTDTTFEIIASHGGWTYAAAEELKPDDDALAAHCLLLPPRQLQPKDVADWLQENRTPLLAQRIEAFLDDVGPLRDDPEPTSSAPWGPGR